MNSNQIIAREYAMQNMRLDIYDYELIESLSNTFIVYDINLRIKYNELNNKIFNTVNNSIENIKRLSNANSKY